MPQLVDVGALQWALLLQALFTSGLKVIHAAEVNTVEAHCVRVHVMKPIARDVGALLDPTVALIEDGLQHEVPAVVGVVFLQVVLKELLDVYLACPRCAIAL